MTFAEATRHRYAVSMRLLGWRPSEFWHATPTELAMALADPAEAAGGPPPDHDTISRMMERDADERRI